MERFCAEMWPRLVSGLSLWCENVAVAEELAQEALVRTWERWDRVRLADSPEAWTWRVAINLSRSRRRRAGAERRAMRRLRADAQPAADDPPSLDEDLRRALLQLPPRQQQAVVLRFVSDLPVASAAEAMDCAEGTVRALTHQGLEQLRLVLGVRPTDRKEVLPDG